MALLSGTGPGVSTLAQYFDDHHHMRGWDGGWMWLWGSLMMLTWALIIGGVTWYVVGRRRIEPPPSRSRKVLEERLVRGEISIEEYRTLRTELGRRDRD